ncbi:MAG: GNAT family N-acetyltransferase, partial [Desulfofustis sp.]|nr:GNAT family N-acetyltransferase [Desulfofustis sp.]
KAYLSEAELYQDYSLPPLPQTLMGIEEDFKKQMILKAMSDGRIVGSVRAYAKEGVCHIGRLVVEPTYQNKGLGSRLLNAIEARFPAATRFELFTGERSKKSMYLYHKAGYEIFPSIFLCYFEIKSNSRSATFSAWSEILPRRSMS